MVVFLVQWPTLLTLLMFPILAHRVIKGQAIVYGKIIVRIMVSQHDRELVRGISMKPSRIIRRCIGYALGLALLGSWPVGAPAVTEPLDAEPRLELRSLVRAA